MENPSREKDKSNNITYEWRMEMNRKIQELETRLNGLKHLREQARSNLEYITSQIKQKVETHNKLVASVSGLKREYKTNITKFSLLKAQVREYKKSQREELAREYSQQIEKVLKELNSIKFDFKLSVFKSFDKAFGTQTDMFPILHAKKLAFIDSKRASLKNSILGEISKGIQNNSLLSDLVFNINFIIKFEQYFNEEVLIEFVCRTIEKEFEYHFLTDRDSNRLDKPEWFFDFILKRYRELEPVVQIYSDCRFNQGISPKTFTEVITQTQSLVFYKLGEISKLEGAQKRDLVLRFVQRFRQYSQKVREVYSIDLDFSQVKHVLSRTQIKYIKTELARIHDLRYVQWVGEYKALCRDAMLYINEYGWIDTGFSLDFLMDLIISHTRSFVDNLRFINREEINVVSFLFSELEDLKAYALQEEADILLASDTNCSAATSSIDKLTAFNSNMFKLIKKLAVNDTENILKKVVFFNYSSNEARRTVIVELNSILDEYSSCIYSDLVVKTIKEKIDQILFDEILMKIRLSSDEYLEFRGFFASLKKKVAPNDDFKWKSDDACKCIDGIFEGRTINNPLFKSLKILYHG